MRPPIFVKTLRAFLLATLALWAPVALAEGMSHAALTAEYGPTAPERIVADLQARARSDVPALFLGALPKDLEGRAWQIAVETASGGISVQVEVEGSPADAKAAAQALIVPLEDLVHEVGGDYSAQVTLESSGFALPGLALPKLALPELPKVPGIPGGAGMAAVGAIVAGAGALLVFFLIRRGLRGPKRLPLPTLWGAPVLGLLPESLARVGKLYHLQSKPCQAMGYFFMQQAPSIRKVAVTAPTPEAGGTVAVTLGQFLVREGQKVLLVDLSGETNVVPAIFARFGAPPGEACDGAAAGTGIQDLDLMTMSRADAALPELPAEIEHGYDRIIYVIPPGQRPRGVPCVDVVLKPSLKAALAAAFGAPRVGWVFFGDGVPMRVSDRYYTRYYYEKLHEVSAT
ncbi:MAG: hypothetical protein FJZ01_04680 [Candidatus Sericytochromatia bacterium]|nr:hypothetical protein [Candidatus Tanganyikabacteria bacterium]